VYFDGTEVGKDLINFPCTELPIGPESFAYGCAGPTPANLCTCIGKPIYRPSGKRR